MWNMEGTTMMQNEQLMDLSSGTPQPTEENAPWNTGYTPAPEPPQSFHTVPVPPAAQRPQRVRRVGSFTMGVALIACGILVLLYLLFHNAAMVVAAAKWSPVLLILLGAEVLLSNFLFSKDKLKYDFISGFFCLCLIGGSLMISMASVVYQYGFGRESAETAIGRQIDDLCYQKLQGTQEIASLRARVSINGMPQEMPETYDKLRPVDEVYTEIRLLGSDKNALAFAQRCKGIVDRLKPNDLSIQMLYFFSGNIDQGEPSYSLTVDNRFQEALSAENLAELVHTSLPEPAPEGDPPSEA